MRNNPREALLEVHRRHARAWENRNFEEMRAVFADDAVIFGTEPPSRFADFKTFENTLQQYFSNISDVTFSTSNIQIEITEAVGWITSLFVRTYRQNEEEQRESGRWTELYLQKEADWKLIHFHASKDP